MKHHLLRSLFSAGPGATGMSLDPTVQALRGAAADAQRSRLPQMAAALSYRTVFGILPVLAIGLWILHRVVKPEDLREYIHRGINALGLSSIVVQQDAAMDPNLFVGPLPSPDHAAPPASLEQWISAFVERINGVSFTAIGLVGVGMLIYAAISMIVEIERAFNQIYRVPRGRSWVRRIVNYWTLITLGSLGLLATFTIQQQLGDWAGRWTAGRTGFGSGYITLNTIGFATQWVISAAVLLLLYTAVPNTKVRFVPALWGALLAAAIFESSKFAFGKYVEFSAGVKYARLYGSLALIPLFLLWVYFSWLIVLFGVQLTYYLQHGRARTRAQPIMDLCPTLVDPASVLTVMSTIARAFAEGRTLDAPAIAQRVRLADPLVRIVLARLTERGLLHRIDTHPDDTASDAAEPTYALARPPEAISVAELLADGFALAAESAGADDPVLGRIRQAQLAAAGTDTLADVLHAGTRPTPAAGTARSAEPLSPALLRPVRTTTGGNQPA